MSVSNVPNSVVQHWTTVNGRLQFTRDGLVKYSFSNRSIPSATSIKLHLTRSHCAIQLLPFLLNKPISSRFTALVTHDSGGAREEGVNALDEVENIGDIEEGDEECFDRRNGGYGGLQKVQADMSDWGISKTVLSGAIKQDEENKHRTHEMQEMPYMEMSDGSKLYADGDEEALAQAMESKEYKLPLDTEVPDWQNDAESNLFTGNEEQFVTGAEPGGLDGGEGWGLNEPPQEPYTPKPELFEGQKLYVGNLPYVVDSRMLAEHFSKAGIVEIAEIVYNLETDQSRGFGFVTMSTDASAEKAVRMLHHSEIGGRLMVVHKAFTKGSRPERFRPPFVAGYAVYCGNIPYDVDDARLHEVFSEYGNVLNVNIVNDKETGQSRGFGFVTMSTQTEQENAVAALDGQSLDGRRLRVAKAEPRPWFGANGIVSNRLAGSDNGLDQSQNGFEKEYGENVEYSQVQRGQSEYNQE